MTRRPSAQWLHTSAPSSRPRLWLKVSAAQFVLSLLAGSYVWLRFNSQRRERELAALVAERTRSLQSADAALKRRHQIADGMRDVMTALNSDQPLDEILAMIAGHCCDLLGADAVAIGEVQETSGALILHARSDTAGKTRQPLPCPVTDADVLAAIAAGQVAVVAPIPQALRAAGQAHDTRQLQAAVLIVPVLADAARFRGGMLMCYADRALITEAEIELATPFAAQAALAIENAQLKATAREMATVEERNRVARELHDSVTQYLYAIVLNADAALLTLDAGKFEKSAEQLQLLKSIARSAMSEVRLLIYELRPASVQELGLEAALQQRLQAVEVRSGLTVNFQARLEWEIPPHMEDVLFRVILEGLNNVLKHAHASELLLHIVALDGCCRVVLHDNGAGFDVTTARRYGGYGLGTIDERLQQVHGKLTIHSQPGAGSTLEIEVPL